MSTIALLKSLLYLETALCFKIFEKVKVISLYWFAAQQSSAFRGQKFGLFYLKPSAEFNELILNV